MVKIDTSFHFIQTKNIEVNFRKIEMYIKIEMLRAFAAVAHSGSLRAGAEALSKTPSALSMMLKQFESHLGEPLFETERKNRLTPLGLFVLEEADRQLQSFDSTVQAIEGFAQAKRGRVRIATVPSVTGTILAKTLAAHAEEFENLHIEIRDMDSKSVLRALSASEADIGIASVGGAHSMGLESELILTDRFGVVVRKDHPLAETEGEIHWDVLQPFRFIANSLSAGIDAPIAQGLHANANLWAHNTMSILAMVQSNLGYTILPETVTASIEAHNSVFRPLVAPVALRHIHLIQKAQAFQSPVVQFVAKRICQSANEIQ